MGAEGAALPRAGEVPRGAECPQGGSRPALSLACLWAPCSPWHGSLWRPSSDSPSCHLGFKCGSPMAHLMGDWSDVGAPRPAPYPHPTDCVFSKDSHLLCGPFPPPFPASSALFSHSSAQRRSVLSLPVHSPCPDLAPSPRSAPNSQEWLCLLSCPATPTCHTPALSGRHHSQTLLQQR